MLEGHQYSDYYEEFNDLVDKTEFYYECHRNCIYHFYVKPEHEELNNAYLEYFEWQWVCKLLKPNYTDLYHEVFEFF